MGSTPGSINLVLKSIQGKGPEGTVAVTQVHGKNMIKLTGEGCANAVIPLRPTPNLNVHGTGTFSKGG